MKASKWFLELRFLTKISCLGAQCLQNIRLGWFFSSVLVSFPHVCCLMGCFFSPLPLFKMLSAKWQWLFKPSN